MRNIFLSIGSNLDDPLKNCLEAINLFKEQKDITLEKSSSLYHTEPVGYKEQNWFINFVLEISSTLNPFSLLVSCKEIEKMLGRKESQVFWGPRVIDIDILFYDNLIIESEDLIIPHPRLHLRKFVLVPLNEINESFVHPVLKKTTSELLADLNNSAVVEKIAGVDLSVNPTGRVTDAPTPTENIKE